MPTVDTPTRFVPLSKWAEHYDWPTVPAMRWMLYNASTNGLDRFNATRRVGRRILIDPEAFHRWIDSNPGTTGVA